MTETANTAELFKMTSGTPRTNPAHRGSWLMTFQQSNCSKTIRYLVIFSASANAM